jgi:hypothetical protein
MGAQAPWLACNLTHYNPFAAACQQKVEGTAGRRPLDAIGNGQEKSTHY